MSFQKNNKFTLLPVEFKNNEILDEKYTPFGQGRIPFFEINNVPRNTKSFAFTIEDPDAPNGKWYHIILININKNVNRIRENKLVGESITNSWGNNKYKGPKPPFGTHHYHFIVYALDIEYISARNIKEFEKKIKNHIIDKAEIIGLFGKQKSKEL